MDAESGGSALSSPSDVTMSDGASPQERKIQDIKGRSASITEKKTIYTYRKVHVSKWINLQLL
jgi:hypothetical protein